MPKILFFIRTLTNPAGTERISTALANALSDKGYHVDFVVHDSDARCFFELGPGINVFSLGLDKNMGAHKIKAASRLHRLIKKHRYDIILNVGVSCAYVTYLACPLFYGCKIFSWEHFSINTLGPAGRIKRYLSACFSYRTIVLTHTDRNFYPAFLHKKMTVIPNFTCINPDGLTAKLESKTVLAAGRIEGKIKGFDLLVEAWQEVARHYPDWTLKIAGGGNPYELSNNIHALSLEQSVRLTGAVKNMAGEYLDSSLFVLTSRSESFGLVIIEAMSFGLPVVSFDCPNGPREIIEDGINGRLVKNGNVKELSKALMEMISDKGKRARFGKSAQCKYKAQYTLDKILDTWLAILK